METVTFPEEIRRNDSENSKDSSDRHKSGSPNPDIVIGIYHPKYDDDLLRIFYRDIYRDRKEVEYYRYPRNWLNRYKGKEHVIRVAFHEGKPVATLGAFIYEGFVEGERKRLAFFVDNCTDPDHWDSKDKISEVLFRAIIDELKSKGVSFLFGWEFVHKYEKSRHMYSNLGFSVKKGFYWYPTGANVNIESGDPIENKIPMYWKWLCRIQRLRLRLIEKRQKAPFKIREIRKGDIPDVTRLVNEQGKRKRFGRSYTEAEITDFIEKTGVGLVALKRGRIEGSILFYYAPWSGWFCKRPEYDSNHSFFFSITSMEIVSGDDKRVEASLIFSAMKFADPRKYSPYVDCFDHDLEKREKVLGDIGGKKADYDHGCLIYKDLESGFTEETNDQVFHVPTEFVIAPVARDHLILKNKANQGFKEIEEIISNHTRSE